MPAPSSYELPAGPKLNLGCGPVQPPGWVNIDGSTRAFFASKFHLLDRLLVKLRLFPATEFNKLTKYHRLHKGCPYADDSVACIYAGELWEHFEYEDACRLTRDCYRVLKPNGLLRLRVPDGPTIWSRYLNIYQEIMTKPRNCRAAEPLRQCIGRFFTDLRRRPGLFQSVGHVHKWLYDEVQLIEMLERSGFVCVQRMQYHASRIPDIQAIERAGFLIVEGLKAR